ncbi:MAG TPA: ATP-dependent Clp protease adapter ClpS [bacterium]|jgi:ATP-dependent Clp protease adaptor protein ClpS
MAERDDLQRDEETLTDRRQKVQKPPMYKVLLHNDDYTTMEFVVAVLMRFFHMDEPRAHQVMMNVHQRGVGVAGVYTYEVAETKMVQVHEFARQREHPLKCTMEPA